MFAGLLLDYNSCRIVVKKRNAVGSHIARFLFGERQSYLRLLRVQIARLNAVWQNRVMDTRKTKAKSAGSKPANKKGEKPGDIHVSATEQEQFSALVESIAKRYGVKVGPTSAPATNPYAMSAEQAAKVALQAGIITRAGNLTRKFK